MTAPFPTRKQEEWRYADLDALKPVWDQFAEPVTLTVGAGESLEDVWLPGPDDVQLRRVQLALEAGAKARIFALNTAPVYGRIELEISLGEGAEFELYGANIGSGLSTNEIVTNVRHLGAGGRSRQVVRSVLNGKAVGSYLGKVEVARGAQQTDAEQSVKAMLLDRGATANCKPELEIFADDVKCAHGASVGELDAMQLFYAESRGLDPASARALLLEGFVMGLWDSAREPNAICEAAREALRNVSLLPAGAAGGEGDRSAQLSGGGAGPSVSPLARPATSPLLRNSEERQ
jgi:Fe-S cluster assembly protein SufD